MNANTELDHAYISGTQMWLNTVIIGYNLCPFARHEQERGSIRYSVDQHAKIENCLLAMMTEIERMDSDSTIETTLLIYARAFSSFDDYLGFLALAEALLAEQGYEGVYQLASFHPNYCFEGAPQDDPANYTNRSPYPMLHLLRESSIEEAVLHYPDPDNIPHRNIELTRRLGLAKLQSLLAACYSSL
jgi:hypothetical protein